jgi:very-short-patch-repair endonuclease
MREGEEKVRAFAKTMRRAMTGAERAVWSRVRRGQIAGHHVRRQHPVCGFIADFACVGARLVIGIDGATHGEDHEVESDRRRDAAMRAAGRRVLRFTNGHVFTHVEDVMASIALALGR